jgi:hypothetical protein
VDKDFLQKVIAGWFLVKEVIYFFHFFLVGHLLDITLFSFFQ